MSRNIVYIDYVAIDEDTGEVLDAPDGAVANLTAFLTGRIVTASAAIKSWEDAKRGLSFALMRRLTDAGVNKIQTEQGTAQIVNTTREKGIPERAETAAAMFELSPRQLDAIMECASALDPKKLRALADAGALPKEAVDYLIERSESSYLRISAPRPAPPQIRRETAPDEDDA
jgi:hypothetical protein